jgi:hypothetical protein
VDILLEKMVEKGMLTHVEAGQIRREIEETKESRHKQLAKELLPGVAMLTFKGDLRLRNEFRNQEGTGNDRNRQRIRFRYGMEAKVNDQLKVIARLATGSSSTGGTTGDPVSTNQSFDTNFVKKGISLDLANVVWTPRVPGVTQADIIGGMMESPFWFVGPLVYDSDLTFDGGALKLAQNVGPARLFSNTGVFSIDTDETETASLWIAQGGAALTLFPDAPLEDDFLKNAKLTGAVTYHDYRNVAKAGIAGTDIIAREAQNSATLKDLDIIQTSLELGSTFAEIPFAFFGDWVRNLDAGSQEKHGLQAGFKLGKATTPWDLKKGWEAGYYFQQLERDAVFDEFTDSDLNDGGTNNRGHVYYVTLATLKNSTLGVKFLDGRQFKKIAGKDTEERLQVDWVTKF